MGDQQQWQSDSNNSGILNVQSSAQGDGATRAPDVPLQNAPTSFAEAAEFYLKSLEGVQISESGTASVPDGVVNKEPVPDAPVQASTDVNVVELLKTMGVTKFDTPEKFAKSYVEQEAFNTRITQDNALLRNTVSELQARMAQYESLNNQQQQAPQQTQQQAPEYDPQTDINAFYENPKEFLAKYLSSAIEPLKQEFQQQVNPIAQRVAEDTAKTARQAAAEKFFASNPDAQEFMQPMADLLAKDDVFNGLTDPDSLLERMNNALIFAKGQRYQKPQTVDDVAAKLLSDADLFNKYIAGNEEVKKKLLSSVVQSVQQMKVPPTVTLPSSAQVVIKEADKPSTFEALGDLLKKKMGF